MSIEEQQSDEREAIKAMYDDDENFKVINDTTFQCKVTSTINEKKTLLVQIEWTKNYPDEGPLINLDLFYNNFLSSECKSHIKQKIENEIEHYLGSPMTFVLFDHVQQNIDELIPDIIPSSTENKEENVPTEIQTKNVKIKKEQLTKSQKRRMYNKLSTTGELPRGHDWVDIVRHLSQTGGQET
ncbi:unnamed protein product [Dimorphilus gyrociliatus]|uniref:RWD domain-containing protein n=1 Tax=Dimorphilus gyrociliatus TaxID=2664684 RepID=A0A7I8W7I3_9ANNE|nr:unnamed protein product [Dimorphilus gyrociliatus]